MVSLLSKYHMPPYAAKIPAALLFRLENSFSEKDLVDIKLDIIQQLTPAAHTADS